MLGAILALEPQTHCSSPTITYSPNNDYTEGETESSSVLPRFPPQQIQGLNTQSRLALNLVIL